MRQLKMDYLWTILWNIARIQNLIIKAFSIDLKNIDCVKKASARQKLFHVYGFNSHFFNQIRNWQLSLVMLGKPRRYMWIFS
ncbi:hypothetical protein RAZWK3B_00975 [Roseobacter sp. AzwK-3b]|nr:hypothetical protein RAZWK3B_00975 [Roseobacter sp. AzwK-3b]